MTIAAKKIFQTLNCEMLTDKNMLNNMLKNHLRLVSNNN